MDLPWTFLRTALRTVPFMKATLTSAISMAAILGSGGAALAVNATVLDPKPDSTPSSTEVPAADTATSTPTSGVDEFQIPGIGLVSMSMVDGRLILESVDANDGISYTVTETAPGEYEIRFESDAQTVTFTARLVEGHIVTSATGIGPEPPVTNVTSPATPTGGGSGVVTGPASSGSSFDHEDDDYEDHNESEDHGDEDHDEGHDDDD